MIDVDVEPPKEASGVAGVWAPAVAVVDGATWRPHDRSSTSKPPKERQASRGYGRRRRGVDGATPAGMIS